MNQINCKITNENLNSHDVSITGITYDNNLYYSMDALADKLNICYKTIQRKIDKVRKQENLNLLDYLIQTDKNFVSLKLFENTKYTKRLQCKSEQSVYTKNTIASNNLQKEYVKLYENESWDFFCCINFEQKNTQQKTMTYMDKLASQLKEISNTDFKLLYTIEKNPDRIGYHVHFLISIKNKSEFSGFEAHMRKVLKKQKNYLNEDIKPYNSLLNGLEYIFKQSDRGDFEHNLIN